MLIQLIFPLDPYYHRHCHYHFLSFMETPSSALYVPSGNQFAWLIVDRELPSRISDLRVLDFSLSCGILGLTLLFSNSTFHTREKHDEAHCNFCNSVLRSLFLRLEMDKQLYNQVFNFTVFLSPPNSKLNWVVRWSNNDPAASERVKKFFISHISRLSFSF